MSILGTGLTPTQHYAELNRMRTRVWDITSYGAVGDDDTDNTAAIQAAIEAAHLVGGWVYVPIGVFKTHTLTLYANVGLFGNMYFTSYSIQDWGNDGSVLKSIAAEPLINSLFTEPQRPLGIKDITLNGNIELGTVGYNCRLHTGFVIDRVMIIHFATYGISLNGCLCGEIKNSWIFANGTGIYAKLCNDEGTGYNMMPNLINISNSTINYNTNYGVYFTGGFGLQITGTSIESAGIANNPATGAVYFKGGTSTVNEVHIGLIMKGIWIENYDGILVNIDEPVSTMKQLSIIENCLFLKYNKTPLCDIQIIGASTENKLILRSSSSQNDASVIMTGANAIMVNDQSVISGTVTGTGAEAGYFEIIPTLVT